MALLYRFSKLNDRSNTGIFTFIVTRSVTRDLHRDATTKDFYYGYHRWAISFTRANDKILGVYLILRDISPSTITYTDFSITLLNREHFSRNEQYGEKQSKFTMEHSAHGINKWIPLSDIQTRNFGDETGEFLLELSLGNLMTVYETNICLQNSGNQQQHHHHHSHHHQQSNNSNNNNNQISSTSSSTTTTTTSSTSSPSSSTTTTSASTTTSTTTAKISFKNGKLETNYFHFGTFEWNLTIQMHNLNSGSSGAASMVRGLFKDNTQNDSLDLFSSSSGNKSNRSYLIFLNRLTGFENSCRVQYRIVLGHDQIRDDSGVIEQISDMNGRCRGYQIDSQLFSQLTSIGTANLYFEFYSCNPISEAKVSITRSISPTINCYDRNKQGWSIESDMEGETLKLKLYFMDMHSVPRNHLRYVSWYVYLIVQDQHGQNGQTENIMVKHSPHYNYYIQDGIDMGVVMETDILVSDIKSSGKKYLENDNNLTVHVEWYDSIMLFNHIYHKYDDIARMNCHQMRREIAALTKENYSLERQIFAYQRSISLANNQINAQNNMSRFSISSPSKSNPPSLQLLAQSQQALSNIINYGGGSGAGSGAGGAGTGSNTPSSYRSTTQLDTTNSGYYNQIMDDVNSAASIAAAAAITGSRSNSYYDLNNAASAASGTGTRIISRPDAINYSTERSATPVPSSPMQPPSIAQQQQQQQQHQQQLSNYLGSNLEQGIPTTITSRHSFSGPTTPHHHHHYLQQQQQQQYLTQQTYLTSHQQKHQLYQQSHQHHHHHHHQLPQIPTVNNSIPYSSYRLRSPSSNPNITQMYRDDDAYLTSQITSTTPTATTLEDDGSIDDSYQTYSGRYKLTV